jgi:CopG family nickel-responsive transcriptional regulator
VTITIDDDLMAELDRLIAARGYTGRSEAVRDVARAGIQQALLDANAAPDCVAAVVYVYEHGARNLARRLSALFHDNHDLSVANMHVPLNHESGLEVAILKGPTEQVRSLALSVLAERGVRNGRTIIVPAVMDAGAHSHDNAPPEHVHTHIRTR